MLTRQAGHHHFLVADLRLSKLQLMAENFAGAVNSAIDALLATGKGTSAATGGASSAPKAAKPVERYVPSSQLPESIQMNREPYMQGEWRKEPYIPRQCPPFGQTTLLVATGTSPTVHSTCVSSFCRRQYR